MRPRSQPLSQSLPITPASPACPAGNDTVMAPRMRRRTPRAGLLPLALAALATAAPAANPAASGSARTINLQVHATIDLGQPVEQFRAVPVRMGAGQTEAVCALYGSDAEIDPFRKMFFFPKSTLRMVLFDINGRVLWNRDLGPGIIPGVWFAPIFAFDMDGDGIDEIYHVNTTSPGHPLDHDAYQLERIDPRTGKATGAWPFPQPRHEQQMSHLYRHFIFAGHVRGQPVLVAANGTYGPMRLRAYNPDMSTRWEVLLDSPADGGAAGTHMCAVVDLDGDRADEVMWGERALRLDDGTPLFAADAGAWMSHSDIVQPVLDRATGAWWLWTCREGAPQVSPRLVMFDGAGRRAWSDVARGHMDTGWAAHLAADRPPTVFSIRMRGKSRDARGERRVGVEEFAYEAFSGRRQEFPFQLYTTIPVDLDGDGCHELVRGYFEGDGAVLDAGGRVLGNVGGHVALASKFTGHPGEQLLVYNREGRVTIHRDAAAVDSPAALRRYAHPFYLPNQKLPGVGYNLFNLGGL